jgi:predicted amidophosphoribosyltransferase
MAERLGCAGELCPICGTPTFDFIGNVCPGCGEEWAPMRRCPRCGEPADGLFNANPQNPDGPFCNRCGWPEQDVDVGAIMGEGSYGPD